MKYLSQDLADCFEKMSATIFKLNGLLTVVLKNNQKLNRTVNLSDEYQIDTLTEHLKEGLNGWSTWCLTNKRLLNDHFVNFLHFKKHEYVALQEIVSQTKYAESIANEFKSNLADKTWKLFNSKNIEKWCVPSSEFKEELEVILKDYSIASKYILPEEQKKMAALKKLSVEVNTSLFYEYLEFNKRDQRRTVRNFNEFAKKCRTATQVVGPPCNHLGRHNMEHLREGGGRRGRPRQYKADRDKEAH
jgi:hypothetical protein